MDYCYEEIGYDYGQKRPNVYPTWVGTRGQPIEDRSPYEQQAREVNPKVRMGYKQSHSSPVDAHRVEGATLDPGRVLTHPSRIVAPLLLMSDQPQTFDTPHWIIAWAPNPIVQRSFGQWAPVPDDTVPRVPKLMPSYSTDALSQQEIADQAALQVRRALYGR